MPVRSRVAVLLLVGFALTLPSYAAGVAPEKPEEREIAGLLEASWSNLVRVFERAMAKIDPPDDLANEPPTGNGDGDRGATLDPWG
ncbi:MAG TPA: hypothetical protein VLQ45_26875 [Thermoanaerobaculia bacterium]|nr:hypothetical protein [Thermoanaerobaculia bacterium]